MSVVPDTFLITFLPFQQSIKPSGYTSLAVSNLENPFLSSCLTLVIVGLCWKEWCYNPDFWEYQTHIEFVIPGELSYLLTCFLFDNVKTENIKLQNTFIFHVSNISKGTLIPKSISWGTISKATGFAVLVLKMFLPLIQIVHLFLPGVYVIWLSCLNIKSVNVIHCSSTLPITKLPFSTLTQQTLFNTLNIHSTALVPYPYIYTCIYNLAVLRTNK